MTASSDFFGRNMPAFQHFEPVVQLACPIMADQIPQFDLIQDVPAGITRPVMRQSRRALAVRPAANAVRWPARSNVRRPPNRMSPGNNTRPVCPPARVRALFPHTPFPRSRRPARRCPPRLRQINHAAASRKTRPHRRAISHPPISRRPPAARKTTGGHFRQTIAAPRRPVRAPDRLIS